MRKLRVAICTVQVPFVKGGAEYLASSLREELERRGYEADIVSMPFKWYPPSRIIDSMLAWRLVDLTEANGSPVDRIIALKFPAYYVRHHDKRLWIAHQHRQAYDLWETNFGDLHGTTEGRRVRQVIVGSDNEIMREARCIFTISKTVTGRMLHYNGIASVPLYPPPLNADKLRPGEFGDYVYYPSRLETIKRQKLLVESLKYTRTPVAVVLSGTGNARYLRDMEEFIERNRLKDRVRLAGFVSDEEKVALFANCLAVYFGAFNEDYGYVTLEAFFSGKPVLVHTDAGGPLEFVDEDTGFVVEPRPEAVAERLDELYMNRRMAREKGQNGLERMKVMNITWDYVISELMK